MQRKKLSNDHGDNHSNHKPDDNDYELGDNDRHILTNHDGN